MNIKTIKNLNLFKDELLDLKKLKNQGFININYLLKTSNKSYIVRVFKSKNSVNISREFEFKTQKKAWAEATHPNREGVSVDRIDNDKGYSPENCRWVDVTTQILNQRKRKDNTSGYTGVTWHKNVKRWCSTLKSQGVLINVGTFKDKIEAVLARDNYIIENNLPHKLSTDYKREEKINE